MHHMRRIGVTADIIATPEGVTIRTSARVASYKGEELGQLILERPPGSGNKAHRAPVVGAPGRAWAPRPIPGIPRGLLVSPARGYHWYQIAHNAISRGLARP